MKMHGTTIRFILNNNFLTSGFTSDYQYRRTPISADPVSAVYHGPQKIGRIKEINSS